MGALELAEGLLRRTDRAGRFAECPWTDRRSSTYSGTVTIETSIGLETGQPYPYQRVELVEPDWTRFPGWRDVTAAEWASVQWQRAHCVKNLRQLRDLLG